MVWIYIVFILVQCASLQSSDVTVTTNIGVVRGRSESINAFDETYVVNKFLGIPFAEAPIGELRFKQPLPKVHKEREIDATKYGSACLQPNIGMQPSSDTRYSEDCLFLNIYVPVRPDEELLAVMVWFHGGGFISGSGDLYPGDHLAVYGNVIVVTVNYRLSLWGFLSTKDNNAPGNYGLWDQQMAIKWIHDNIAAFGGDNSRVTLFGESAGGASVVFHALYPPNRGLFQRIIAQSGTASAWWPTNDDPVKDTKTLATFVGCDLSTSEKIVACLRDIPEEKLLNIINDRKAGLQRVPIPFIPSVDNEYIKLSGRDTFVDTVNLPEDIMDFYLSLDIMAGMNSGEGSLSVSPFFGVEDPENFFPDKSTFEDYLVPLLQDMAYPENRDKLIKDLIILEYTNWTNLNDKLPIREQFMSMHTDSIFTDPLYRTLEYHANSTRGNYMYYFNENSRNHLFCHMSWFDDMAHGDDIPYVFGYKHADHVKDWKFTPSDWEKTLSKKVIKLWSNFAKSGNPNLPYNLDVDWLPYTKKHQHYLQISRGMTSSNVKQRWNLRGAKFWGQILPDVIKALSRSRS